LYLADQNRETVIIRCAPDFVTTRLLDAGTLRVAIDSTYSLADARKAHERAAAGHIQGKIVLDVE
jgi:NADPH:quinone reductase-like Zn-dependent oxidoreductase